MEGYSATIKYSSKQLTPKERVMLKDTTDAIKIDKLVNDGETPIIYPVAYVVLGVHNESAKNDKDYEVYVIIDKGGKKYVTGSPSFSSAFVDIFDEMGELEGEEWGVRVFRLPSKNYDGKYFLTCSVV